jgi:hypothetical protein
MINATTAKEIKTMQTFTTADADRLLGLADQFMEDWEANEGKDDPECAERRAEWNAIRPLLVQAPAMLTAIRTMIERADDIISAIDGATDQFEPEVAGLSAATSAAERSSTASGASRKADFPLDRRRANRAFRALSHKRKKPQFLIFFPKHVAFARPTEPTRLPCISGTVSHPTFWKIRDSLLDSCYDNPHARPCAQITASFSCQTAGSVPILRKP